MMKGADFLCFDFETLGKVAWNCKVIQFGAIAGSYSDVKIGNDQEIKETIERFRSTGLELFFDTTYQPDRKTDKSTIDFWAGQNKDVRDHAFGLGKNKIHISDYYRCLKSWADDRYVDKNTTVLVRAPHYDETISESLIENAGYANEAYSHWRVRDTRSIVDTLLDTDRGHLPGFEQYMTKTFGMKKHTALDDCIIDILELTFCYSGASKNDFKHFKT